MVKYVYDAWGKFLSTTGSLASTLGAVQQFRYRSYVYDQETGLYYLRSRYYSPVLCKFFCTDSWVGNIGELHSHNAFNYCANSPIMLVDHDGNVWVQGAPAPYYSYFHNMVQNWIITFNPGLTMEVPTSTGRIDLYNVYTHEIYEVKPNTTGHKAAGINQLMRYLAGDKPVIMGEKLLILPPDGTLRIDHTEMTILVNVKQEEALILYTVEIIRKKKQSQTVSELILVPNLDFEKASTPIMQPNWNTVTTSATAGAGTFIALYAIAKIIPGFVDDLILALAMTVF